jgi:hypothetical protein
LSHNSVWFESYNAIQSKDIDDFTSRFLLKYLQSVKNVTNVIKGIKLQIRGKDLPAEMQPSDSTSVGPQHDNLQRQPLVPQL